MKQANKRTFQQRQSGSPEFVNGHPKAEVGPAWTERQLSSFHQ